MVPKAAYTWLRQLQNPYFVKPYDGSRRTQQAIEANPMRLVAFGSNAAMREAR